MEDTYFGNTEQLLGHIFFQFLLYMSINQSYFNSDTVVVYCTGSV